MRLFTIPITTGPHAGKELVGIQKPIVCTCFPIDPDCQKLCDASEEARLLRKHKAFTLSDITEKQTQELGFGPEEKSTTRWSAKDQLQLAAWDRIHYEGRTRIVKDDLSNILLILVNK